MWATFQSRYCWGDVVGILHVLVEKVYRFFIQSISILLVSRCCLDLHFLDPGEGGHLCRCILATWDNAPECDLSHFSREQSVLLLLIVGVTILYVWASTHSLFYMLKKSIFCLLTCLLVLFMVSFSIWKLLQNLYVIQLVHLPFMAFGCCILF